MNTLGLPLKTVLVKRLLHIRFNWVFLQTRHTLTYVISKLTTTVSLLKPKWISWFQHSFLYMPQVDFFLQNVTSSYPVYLHLSFFFISCLNLSTSVLYSFFFPQGYSLHILFVHSWIWSILFFCNFPLTYESSKKSLDFWKIKLPINHSRRNSLSLIVKPTK